jgi:hypothetical protein
MSALAQIWYDSGEIARARKLLVDCMRGLITLIQVSKYNSDCKMFAGKFQYHRSTYLRLFPKSENELVELDIPAEPLNLKKAR